MIDEPGNYDTESHHPVDQLYAVVETNYGSVILYDEPAEKVCELIRELVKQSRS